MEEKVSKVIADSQFKKERFSFELRINDYIVCQRYFRINGFKKQSLSSTELLETLRYCARLIQDDLKDKTNDFYMYTAPQVFKNEEEMYKFAQNRPWMSHTRVVECNGKEVLVNEHIPQFIILEESDQNYVWNGETVEPYDKFINKVDYIHSGDTVPCVLKLAFLDNEVEVCHTCWDGNVYPRFIRTNIDLSNSKNKYKSDGVFAPFEASVVAMLNEGRCDLIPIIVKEFCLCCSYENARDYHVNDNHVAEKWNEYVSSLERKYKKKTEQYFASISE